MYAHEAHKQSKSEKSEEWKTCPVQDDRQRQMWRAKKREKIPQPGPSPPAGQPGTESDNNPAALPAQVEVLQSMEGIASPTQTPPHNSVSVGSPLSRALEQNVVSVARIASPAAGALGSIRLLEPENAASSPSRPTGTVEDSISPPNRTVDMGRWRKYF